MKANNRFPLTMICALATAAAVPAQLGRYRDEVFSQVTVQPNVAYGQAVNFFSQQLETLLLDVYTPAGDAASARPAIVLVHGGGFVAGSKNDPNYVQIADAFARRGYVAAVIEYRLATPPFMGMLGQAVIDASHDLKAAVRWLRANAGSLGIDTGRIACLGGSSGGITCLNAAYADALGEGSSGSPGFPSDVQAVISLWGAIPELSDIEAGEAPMQVIHGTNDPIVPYQNALDLVAQANSVGLYAELLPIQGGGHAQYQAYLTTYQAESYAFLYEQLALGQLAGLTARPGFGSPGSLTLDTFGIGGAFYAIAAATQPASIPMPGLGTLCIGPIQALVIVTDGLFAATPRLGSASWSVAVPAGLTGVSFHWQAIHLDAAASGWLTNCIETQF